MMLIKLSEARSRHQDVNLRMTTSNFSSLSVQEVLNQISEFNAVRLQTDIICININWQKSEIEFTIVIKITKHSTFLIVLIQDTVQNSLLLLSVSTILS